ncbi:MAG: MBL fold metallo-hydrolase [Hyphomicrobiales bacterium]|nr:MBL fold metallo-hydrolase [Hyphomicrobiales bacterium]
MNQLTRRAALAGAAAAAVAPFATVPSVRAAAPPAGTQAPGWYRYKVGTVEVTVITDGMGRFKVPDGFVGNASKDEIGKALMAAYLDQDTMATPYNPIVVNTGSKLVLIDTGTGEAAFAQSKGATGQLLSNMAAAGVDPKMIDTVIISHYHGDHVNGLLKADNSLAFPNAEVLVPAAEHKFWMDDGEMSRAPKGRMEGLFKNNRRVFSGEVMKRLRTYEEGKEAVPGITAIGTHGHSAGHNSHVITSAGRSVYVQADVTHVPFLFVRNPGWHAMYDQDPVMAEATRRKVYDMLAAEKMPVQGFHYPFPALAHVEKTGSGYREIPVLWSPNI